MTSQSSVHGGLKIKNTTYAITDKRMNMYTRVCARLHYYWKITHSMSAKMVTYVGTLLLHVYLSNLEDCVIILCRSCDVSTPTTYNKCMIKSHKLHLPNALNTATLELHAFVHMPISSGLLYSLNFIELKYGPVLV